MKVFCILALLLMLSSALFTSSMAKRRFKKAVSTETQTPDIIINAEPKLETSCKQINLASAYNYNGIVGTGYLSVSKNNSVLGYVFYGQKDVRSVSELKKYPTVLWLNGGPGSSSQLGNFQEIGPLQIVRDLDVMIKQNSNTWANKYNLLFIDQPVGTGLSYADTTGGANPFVHSMDGTIELTQTWPTTSTKPFFNSTRERAVLATSILTFQLLTPLSYLVRATEESTHQPSLRKSGKTRIPGASWPVSRASLLVMGLLTPTKSFLKLALSLTTSVLLTCRKELISKRCWSMPQGIMLTNSGTWCTTTLTMPLTTLLSRQATSTSTTLRLMANTRVPVFQCRTSGSLSEKPD